jgi:hypothetical protein
MQELSQAVPIEARASDEPHSPSLKPPLPLSRHAMRRLRLKFIGLTSCLALVLGLGIPAAPHAELMSEGVAREDLYDDVQLPLESGGVR